MKSDGDGSMGRLSAQAGASRTQLWQPRPRLWPGSHSDRVKGVGPGCFGGRAERTVKHMSHIFFFGFSFSSKGFISWKMNKLAQKKNRKSIFYLWVEFKKLSESFFTAKEKVYSPVYLYQCGI